MAMIEKLCVDTHYKYIEMVSLDDSLPLACMWVCGLNWKKKNTLTLSVHTLISRMDLAMKISQTILYFHVYFSIEFK